MSNVIRRIALTLSMLLCVSAHATEFSAADYDLYSGDFNGDGKTDLLYIAKSPGMPSGIALADANGVPQIGFQSWPSNYLNIPWSQYKAVIGDFNGDGVDDILLQSKTPGNSYLLLVNNDPNVAPVGQILGVSQAIPQNLFGVAWSADQSNLIVGDFNGDHHADLFFQAMTTNGTNAIVLSDANGNLFTRSTSNCWANGPQQCWSDTQGSHWGFAKWSAQSAVVTAGDFNHDGKTDLLVQPKPKIVLIDYDISIPVPTFPPNSFGIVLAQAANSAGQLFVSANQFWNSNGLGAKWSPLNTNVVVGDFNGDGYADVFLQSKSSGGTNALLLASSNGNGTLQNASAVPSNLAGWSGSSYHLLTGKFGNAARAVLYLQATTAGGANYFTSDISASSVSATNSALLLVANAPAPTAAVGTTSGIAGVTPTGNAEYTVHLNLPQGTAGLTPKLALQYDSGTKHGLLGMGWTLSGFSIITRCPQTKAQDGVTQGVLLQATDQYCLDGNRLRLTSGTQGADGSIYRTEHETFSQVIAHGTSSNGPSWFEVKSHDGLIHEYGNSADSQIVALGTTTPTTWALNKTRDRASTASNGANYIQYSYTNDSLAGSAALGSYRPSQVTYTGNTANGVTPPYTVKFFYEPRASGVYERYFAGSKINEPNRINHIEIQYAGAVTRKYLFSYNSNGGAANSDILSSLQECGVSACLAPTLFSWTSKSSRTRFDAIGGMEVSNAASSLPIDIDGDGCTDVVYFNSSTNTWSVHWGLNDSQGCRARDTNTGVGSGSAFARALATDLDGDGKVDVIVPNGTNWAWLHYRSDGTFAFDDTGTPAINAANAIIVDVDGDGYGDLVWPDFIGNQLMVRFHNRDGSPGFESTSSVAFSAPPSSAIVSVAITGVAQNKFRSSVRVVDVDGDGRQDLLMNLTTSYYYNDNVNEVSSTSGYQVLYSNGSGFIAGDTLPSREPTAPIPIDVNGDGCTDFLYSSPSSDPAHWTSMTWKLAISQCRSIAGQGFAPEIDTAITVSSPWLALAADYDGDGYQDFIYAIPCGIANCPPEAAVALSNGKSFGPAPIAYKQALGVAFNTQPIITDIDGDGLADFGDVFGGFYQVQLHRSSVASLLASVQDGFGNKVGFKYASLTDKTVYTRGAGATFPNKDITTPRYVVKQVNATDGVGGASTIGYAYQQARMNIQGRGFLGFGGRTITDSRTGFVTQETYYQNIDANNNNWEFVGKLTETKLMQSATGPTLRDTANQWSSIKPDNATDRRYAFVSQQTTKNYELGNSGTPVSTVTTNTIIDNFGTPYDVTTTTVENSTGANSGSNSTQRTYVSSLVNDIANWCLGKATTTQAIRSHTLTNGSQLTRTTTQTWDTTQCRRTEQVVEPGSAWALITDYGYDSFSNVNSVTVSGSNIASRQTQINWGPAGQLPIWVKNPLQQQTSFGYDYSRALKTSQTDPNNFVTLWTYDDFGRRTHEVRPDQTGTRWSYGVCNASNSFCGDSLLREMVHIEQRDANDQIITYQDNYFDALYRIKYEQKLGFSSALSVVQTMYDIRGNVASKSMPYYADTDPVRGTTFGYDLYNRLVQSQRPVSDADRSLQTTAAVYSGLTVTEIDPLGGAVTRVTDAWGDVIQATDSARQTVNYTYDAFSNLRSTQDPLGNTATFSSNIRGFKSAGNDPDMGNWTYTYDALGNLLSQTDAKSQTTSFTYDLLSRPKTRTDASGSSPITTWNWDTAANGVGQLGSVTAADGFAEQYAYDTTGRRSSSTTTAAGSNYSINYSYDPTLGSLSTITYPTSTTGRFAVQYDYQNGYIKDVKDASNPSKVYWQAIAQDARGHVIQENLGNGQQSYSNFDETNGRLNYVQTGPGDGAVTQNLNYRWDQVGDLVSRQDANQGLTESFSYDALYRLTGVSLNGTTTQTVSYDAIGNIQNKSDVGAYTYDPTKKHAVLTAGGNTYSYDANGNMQTRNDATVTWYPYNLPQTIRQTGGNYSTFYYGADRSRYRQISQNGATTEDRIYIGGLFEKMTSGSNTEYRHYILANGKAVAIQTLRSTAVNDTYYLHADHLGSVETITGATGSLVIHLSYDAWGKRRASNWSGTPSAADQAAINTASHLGYTSQEQLDNLNLVHMNGRVYDPVIARFISADPNIQAPFHSQSLNRYSYVWNNPLKATDPTGYCGEDDEGDCDPGPPAEEPPPSQPPPGNPDPGPGNVDPAPINPADQPFNDPSCCASPGDNVDGNNFNSGQDTSGSGGDVTRTGSSSSEPGNSQIVLDPVVVEDVRLPVIEKGPDGSYYSLDSRQIEIAKSILPDWISRQAALPGRERGVEHFGRLYSAEGSYSDGEPYPGDKDRMCYGTNCAQRILDNHGDVPSPSSSEPQGPHTYYFDKSDGTRQAITMNVHLHPGSDANSKLFSSSDMSTSRQMNIPVFAGNMNGDLMVFPPGLAPNSSGRGIVLCTGCIK